MKNVEKPTQLLVHLQKNYCVGLKTIWHKDCKGHQENATPRIGLVGSVALQTWKQLLAVSSCKDFRTPVQSICSCILERRTKI